MVVKQNSGRVVGKKPGGDPAAARKRVLVLEGTFSIEEIEVAGSCKKKSRKASGKKKPLRAARKKTAAKKAQSKKTGSKKAGRKKAPRRVAAASTAKPVDENPRQGGPVVLKRQEDIKSISDLQKQLGNAFRTESDVVVDASRVETIDTAALQLLAAFASSLRAQSRNVEWQNPSPIFRELADLTDIGSGLRLDDVPATGGGDLCPVF